MNAYVQRRTVQEEDLDHLDHVNNVRYLEWIQDVSKAHWQHLAPLKFQENMVWVVKHHDISYKNSAKLHDPIKIITHLDQSHGALSVRVVEILNDKTKTLLVRSITKSCLLNKATFRPMRIPEEIHRILHPDPQGNPS